ncbi:MAG: ERF family protein [Actinomycetota bacterium]|nr:ERF family protein [Actinomycetota bacterium]
MSDQPSIHVLMSRIQAELPAIGKDQYNQQQKFHFRGIDAVLNALNPLLAKHGVFYCPHVTERVSEVRETKGGSAMYGVHLHVRYRFYGPNGDYVEASTWGEGTDMGDKATNKAITGAMKQALFQVFAISTGEAPDSDEHTPEQTVARRPQAPGGGRDCPSCGDPLAGQPVVRDHGVYFHKACVEAGAADPGRPFEEAKA